MKGYLKRKFGLTDSGVKAVQRAALISFLVHIGYMALMMIAMYYGDNVLRGVTKPAWYYLLIIVPTLLVLYVLVNREYVLTFNATYKESQSLRLEIADRLRDLPLSYFSRHDLSDLAQTIMQDVTDIEHAMSHAMPRCIAYLFFLLVMAILLLVSNLTLGLAAMLPIMVGLALMLLSQRAQKRWAENYFWKIRETTESFQETIEMQREIKNCGFETENYKAVSASLNASEKLRLRADAVQLIFIIGFLLASMRLVDAVGALEEYFAELFYLDARVQRINELRNTPTQTGMEIELKHFDVELQDVVFAYNEDAPVINDVSFVAKQDQVTAIVGPSGCGKSTILRLISRLYDYGSGNIVIDGQDIRKLSTDALFDKVSFVFQDVILFNASVLDNIRMGRPDATDKEVREAARLANCEDFIQKMPEGYDTLIGENGSNLSGGERQRISIARALLKNAPILLLDEISASLDVENERKIQDALNRLITGKTVIIVSHRLKSIEKADQIVVMDAGLMDAAGTHAELLEKSTLYRKLIEKSSLTESFTY
ncbi:MAG: ABC transporter ATP-binding protein [Candidatus Alectryocaccobium sp.]